MTAKEVLAELESLGTAQNRKIYARHGSCSEDHIFGVSYANLYALRKKIKIDHALAQQLWDSGWYEAQVMACFIADPQQTDAALLDKWASEMPDQGVADAFGGLAVNTETGPAQALKWVKSKAEFVQRCGWNTLGEAMKAGKDGLSLKQLQGLLSHIEKNIHKAPNRAKEGMNYALIALGVYKPEIREEVLAACVRIGPVDIDHGKTGCKTPDAEGYILKTINRGRKPPF
jgi:3-methyladenine DNA glycosylase AlkD